MASEDMTDDNKLNLVFFESASMRELYGKMDAWQKDHRRRLLSLAIHRDGEMFCCIALTNPSEVVIVSGGYLQARVTAGGSLCVQQSSL